MKKFEKLKELYNEIEQMKLRLKEITSEIEVINRNLEKESLNSIIEVIQLLDIQNLTKIRKKITEEVHSRGRLF